MECLSCKKECDDLLCDICVDINKTMRSLEVSKDFLASYTCRIDRLPGRQTPFNSVRDNKRCFRIDYAGVMFAANKNSKDGKGRIVIYLQEKINPGDIAIVKVIKGVHVIRKEDAIGKYGDKIEQNILLGDVNRGKLVEEEREYWVINKYHARKEKIVFTHRVSFAYLNKENKNKYFTTDKEFVIKREISGGDTEAVFGILPLDSRIKVITEYFDIHGNLVKEGLEEKGY